MKIQTHRERGNRKPNRAWQCARAKRFSSHWSSRSWPTPEKIHDFYVVNADVKRPRERFRVADCETSMPTRIKLSPRKLRSRRETRDMRRVRVISLVPRATSLVRANVSTCISKCERYLHEIISRDSRAVIRSCGTRRALEAIKTHRSSHSARQPKTNGESSRSPTSRYHPDLRQREEDRWER